MPESGRHEPRDPQNMIDNETVALLPGPVGRSLGRNRENRLGTRSMPPSWPPTQQQLDPKPNCVGQVPTAR